MTTDQRNAIPCLISFDAESTHKYVPLRLYSVSDNNNNINKNHFVVCCVSPGAQIRRRQITCDCDARAEVLQMHPDIPITKYIITYAQFMQYV